MFQSRIGLLPSAVVFCIIVALLNLHIAGTPSARLASAQDDRTLLPLPAKVRAAWEKAGFDFGWVDGDRESLSLRTYGLETPGELPGFSASRLWKAGTIKPLPAPDL